MSGSALHRVAPGTIVDVTSLPAADTSGAPGDKDVTRSATKRLVERLAELQELLWARRERGVLVVLQGIDTAGKGGTVKHVFGTVNPAGLRVVSFKAPTEPELERDYLWRIHRHVPAAGEIAVFDRSHYEDVMVVRVEELVPEDTWRRRYGHINDFERLLVDEGTILVKLFLQISHDEQQKRLQARLDDPAKRWKMRRRDLDTRAHWDAYQAAFSEAISRTSTDHAPWHIIPADRKWYRNWAVAKVVVDTLEQLDLTWPDSPDDLTGIVIE